MAVCEVCGREEARYVCSNCNKRIGLLCFSKDGWLCTTCAKLEPQLEPEATVPNGRMSPMTLLLFAFIMVLAGYVLLAISAASTGQGGFIVVFPFFVASSGSSGFLFVIALILMVLMLFLAYLSIRKPVHSR